MNFKSIAITLVPDPVAKVARVVVVPEVAGLKAPRTVPAIEGGCGDWRGRLQADINDPMNIRLRGVYPLACGERAIYIGALEHTNYFAAVFRALWERQGGTWTGKVREAAVPASARLIAAQESPPLAMLIRDINKFSNNVMTQQLFLTMGAAVGRARQSRRAAAPRCATCCRRAASTCPGWCSKTAAACRASSASPRRSLANVLSDAWKSQWMPELMASLPISGVDGTMKARNVPAGRGAHEDRPARGHPRRGRLCAGGQRQALRGGGHHQSPQCKPRNRRPTTHSSSGFTGWDRALAEPL